jgi:23S rRNA pseudouridine1911/1915/1917 synthase
MSHVSYAPKQALTHYRVLKYFKKGIKHPECALVNVELVTGRTHQIRVHFAALGHGLLGDAVYGIKSKLIARQALHAWKMSFIFKEKEFSYEAPLPDDLKLMLDELEKCRVKLTE